MLTNYHYGLSVKTSKTTDHGTIITIQTVTVKCIKFSKDFTNII